MSSIFKFYLECISEGGSTEKSLIGQLVAPTISSFGDLIKVLEPCLYTMKKPEGDSFSLRLDVACLDLDLDKDGNKGVSESEG